MNGRNSCCAFGCLVPCKQLGDSPKVISSNGSARMTLQEKPITQIIVVPFVLSYAQRSPCTQNPKKFFEATKDKLPFITTHYTIQSEVEEIAQNRVALTGIGAVFSLASLVSARGETISEATPASLARWTRLTILQIHLHSHGDHGLHRSCFKLFKFCSKF